MRNQRESQARKYKKIKWENENNKITNRLNSEIRKYREWRKKMNTENRKRK